MYKVIILLFLSGLVWSLEIQGPVGPLPVYTRRAERVFLRLKNDTGEIEKIKPALFSGEGIILEMPKNELTLYPFSEQEYVLKVMASCIDEPGEHLYWLTFTRDRHTQSNESGDFTVQDVYYYPLQFVCRDGVTGETMDWRNVMSPKAPK